MSEIRVTDIKGEDGVAAVNFSKGINISSGVCTATTFSGSGASLTSIPDSAIATLTASKLTGALPAISGANLTGILSKNFVLNATATEQSLTASASVIDADIVLTKNNPYLVVQGVVSVNTRTASNLDNENIKFDIEYSTNGGSSYSAGVGDVYRCDVFAPGQDDTHNNQYDINLRPAFGRFQVTANSGTTVRVRILMDYGEVSNSRTIYINRAASTSGQGASTIFVFEE